MSAGMDAIPARNASGISGLWNLTLGDIRGEAGAIALLIPLLLAATYLERISAHLYDTGAYVFRRTRRTLHGGALGPSIRCSCAMQEQERAFGSRR